MFAVSKITCKIPTILTSITGACEQHFLRSVPASDYQPSARCLGSGLVSFIVLRNCSWSMLAIRERCGEKGSELIG